MALKMHGTEKPHGVAFYVRYSSNKQDAENSKAGQISELQKYIDGTDNWLVEIYIDEAISGKREDRPELNRLMSDADRRDCLFSEVVIWRFNRFGRRASTVDQRANELEKRGITLTSIKEPLAGGQAIVRFMRNLHGNISELFSDNMGEDIARGKQESNSHGVWTYGKPPFGYRLRYVLERGKMRPHLEPDPETAHIIRRMKGLYLQGKIQKEIARIFRQENLPGPTGRPRTYSRVTQILKSCLYAGFIKSGERSKHYEISMTPVPEIEIISLDDYGRVQDSMASRATGRRHPRETASENMLSGLVWAELCHRKMSPTAGGRSARGLKYYTCRGKIQGHCDDCVTPVIRNDDLEPAVAYHLVNEVLTGTNLNPIIDSVEVEYESNARGVQESLKDIDLNIEDHKKQRQNLLAKVRAGQMENTDVSDEMREIRERIQESEQAQLIARAQVANEQALTANREEVIKYATDLSTYLRPANVGLMKEILQQVVEEIRIRPRPEENSALVKIIYKIPMPPEDWSEGKNVEEFLLRKNSRSLIPLA